MKLARLKAQSRQLEHQEPAKAKEKMNWQGRQVKKITGRKLNDLYVRKENDDGKKTRK